jgi:hypothetical protein
MKFRCPCCKTQIVPSNENSDEDAQSSSDDSESDNKFISIEVGDADSDGPHELASDIPEIVIDNADATRSETDASVSETTGL